MPRVLHGKEAALTASTRTVGKHQNRAKYLADSTASRAPGCSSSCDSVGYMLEFSADEVQSDLRDASRWYGLALGCHQGDCSSQLGSTARYNFVLPESAADNVNSSADSRPPPAGIPRAMRVRVIGLPFNRSTT